MEFPVEFMPSSRCCDYCGKEKSPEQLLLTVNGNQYICTMCYTSAESLFDLTKTIESKKSIKRKQFF